MATNGSGVMHLPGAEGVIDLGFCKAGVRDAGAVAGGTMPGGSHPPFQHVPPPSARTDPEWRRNRCPTVVARARATGGATLPAGGAMPGGSHPPF